MPPLVDMHVHLLGGLDDGPRDRAEAVAMCRLAHAEGVGWAAALAHQNEHHPAVTPDRIRAAARLLADDLHSHGIPIVAAPCAEVMLRPDLEADLDRGALLSVADRGQYLLVEMPRGLFVDLRPLAGRLSGRGLRLILAHPERHPEFLHDAGVIEGHIAAGCLVQVSAKSLTDPASPADERALKRWVKRGVVHLLGSDGHSPTRRPPKLAAACAVIRRWAGGAAADRIGSTHGLAVLQGLPLRVAAPEPARRRWLPAWW